MTDNELIAALLHNARLDGEYGEMADSLQREAASRLEALVAELERERMRLVACGVVAMCNTPETASKSREMHPDYWSASCADVASAVDREMALRASLARAQEELRVAEDALRRHGYRKSCDIAECADAIRKRRPE